MSQSYSIKNYKTLHFQHQVLDKIHGQPSLDTILPLLRQVKVNAQIVPTTLGGGQLGYLDLVISANDYAAILNSAPFQRPVNPGPFIVQVPRGTQTRTSTTTPTVVTAAAVTQ